MAWFLLKESLTLAYSLLWKLFGLFAFLQKLPLRRLKSFKPLFQQLSLRPQVQVLALDFLKRRLQFKNCIIFFCSSAGEFEQARPVIDQLLKGRQEDLLIIVFFYSASGLSYALSRGEKPTPQLFLTLAPLTDSPWDWGWLFAVLRPSMTTIIRHELWPGFLATAAAYGPVTLMGASVQKEDSFMNKFLKSRLYQTFTRIYCLSNQDKNLLVSRYKIAPNKILMTGDTKYDRVAERSQGNLDTMKIWVEKLAPYLGSTPENKHFKVLVAGSVYAADVAMLSDCFLQFSKTSGYQKDPWSLILVPHHVDPSSIQKITDLCLKSGLNTMNSSHIPIDQPPSKSAPELWSNKSTGPRVIVVDQMGHLAEIYGLGCAAYVGGALHHQIHNVLEPAIRGLSLAWGPRYTNSQEAEFLVNLKLAQVVDSKESLLKWWQSLDSNQLKQNHTQIIATMSSKLGATQRIIEDWKEISPHINDLAIQ